MDPLLILLIGMTVVIGGGTVVSPACVRGFDRWSVGGGSTGDTRGDRAVGDE